MSDQIPNEPRFLSVQEEKILRCLYPNHSNASVAQQMGLKTHQVANYAKVRKLRKSPEYAEAEKARKIARLGGTKHAEEAMTSADHVIPSIVRLQAKPAGEPRRTAHGTAYTINNVTTHVMR